MANRRFTSQFNYSFERMPVSLMGAFTITGVGTNTDTALGMSMSRLGVGLYRITLQDKYPNLLSCQLELQRSSGIANAELQMVSEDVANTKVINIRVISISGQALVDPATNDVIYVRVDLRNSQVSGS